jgi:hypothetical protein
VVAAKNTIKLKGDSNCEIRARSSSGEGIVVWRSVYFKMIFHKKPLLKRISNHNILRLHHEINGPLFKIGSDSVYKTLVCPEINPLKDLSWIFRACRLNGIRGPAKFDTRPSLEYLHGMVALCLIAK